MNESPTLSIIVLSWNHERYIKKTLESIINQTYKDFEIIYLDNASSDDSYNIAVEILEKSNVKSQTKRFSENIGAVKAINFALRNLIHSKYISMIAADDWLDENNYLKKIKYSQTNPEFGIIYSRGYYFFEDTNEFSETSKKDLKEGWIFQDLLKSNFLFMMGTVIKKEVYDEIGFYNEKNSIEDWEFILRAAQKFQIGAVNELLFYYRQHSSNYSKGSNKYFVDCLAVINVYKKEENHKIGYNWILDAYVNFLLIEKVNFTNSYYLLKYIPKKKKSLRVLKNYFLK